MAETPEEQTNVKADVQTTEEHVELEEKEVALESELNQDVAVEEQDNAPEPVKKEDSAVIDAASDNDVDAIDAGAESGAESEPDFEEDVNKLGKFKKTGASTTSTTASPNGSPSPTPSPSKLPRKRQRSESEPTNENIDNSAEDEQARKRREFEEKFNALLKKPTKRRKNNDVDLEAMQDEAISQLKNMMKEAAYMDIDCVNNKKPATNKLKLLPQVRDTLLKSNLYDSILDNNLLEAVRTWLEPLPDASLPSFEIQKTLLNELVKMPIKTIHLRESGLGKVMIFYQKSKKVDSSLKRIAEKLIGDWTRPVMGRSDNYRAREIPTANFDFEKFNKKTKLQSTLKKSENAIVRKSLYQESADRRKRAAAPEARSSVYTIAPQSNLSALQNARNSVITVGGSSNRDERFKAINRKLTKLSQKKKNTKKDGVSIEGRGLNM
jgi:transcription factor SPN1